MDHGYNRPDSIDYKTLLCKLRHFFPTPFLNDSKKNEFIEIVTKQLLDLEKLKSKTPYMGKPSEINYAAALSKRIPEHISSLEDIVNELTEHVQGMPLWAHPRVQMNVAPPPSISSILGTLVGAIYNPNIVEEAYSIKVSQTEIEVCSMCAAMIGYDPNLSAGISTFGGTGTLLYAAKLGIEKASPGTFKTGIREELNIIAAKTAHYCKYTIAEWLGLGLNNVVNVDVYSDNSMDREDLQKTMHELLQKGKKIACIIATIGSTDTFSIDDLRFILKLRDSLVKEYSLPYIPHVHADAVIGWAWSVFNDYDFTHNPMNFPAETRDRLKQIRQELSALREADSIGIDFHKTGYTNYISSFILVKNRNDLRLIARDTHLMPYLFHEGKYHPGTYTLETTRSGASVLAAYANLCLFGKEGYRAILGHIVSLAEYLRHRLENNSFACIVNIFNHGPVTLFRLYPVSINAKESFKEEMQNPAMTHVLQKYNEYNQRIFHILEKQSLDTPNGFVLSYTELAGKTLYGEKILALKSFIMTPFANESSIDALMNCITKAIKEVQLD